MDYKIEYKSSVIKDLKNIDKNEIKKIINKIDNYLSKNPGKDKKLSGDYKDLYSFCVGNYRIIYCIIEEKKIILILIIGHRKGIYKKLY